MLPGRRSPYALVPTLPSFSFVLDHPPYDETKTEADEEKPKEVPDNDPEHDDGDGVHCIGFLLTGFVMSPVTPARDFDINKCLVGGSVIASVAASQRLVAPSPEDLDSPPGDRFVRSRCLC